MQCQLLPPDAPDGCLPNILQCADHRSDAGATRKGAARASCDDVLSHQEAALAKIEPPNQGVAEDGALWTKPLLTWNLKNQLIPNNLLTVDYIAKQSKPLLSVEQHSTLVLSIGRHSHTTSMPH
jgi:hypothetical protein